jgi:transmembrane sensor
MNTPHARSGASEVPSAAACAEAAAWISRLHSTERNAAVEDGFRRWLAASPEHRAAFELANELWNDTDRWPRALALISLRPRGGGSVRSSHRAMLATVAIAIFLSIGAIFYLRAPVLTTQVGEQRTIMLEDGTRVSLNTDTRVRIDYDAGTRRVWLDRGEALFEVARNPRRPFLVTAGDKQVTALGTAFVVRLDDNRTSVMLMEGRISVASVTSSEQPPIWNDPTPGEVAGRASGGERGSPLVLTAGERVTFADGAPRVDRPPIKQVIAWQEGRVVLDHTPLTDAIDEMNRYSVIQLATDQPALGALEVTGVFRSGDSVSFAQAVAETYDLELIGNGRRIRLKSK